MRISAFAIAAVLLCNTALSPAAPAPMRIVSIAPSFTEILYALGLGSAVVGTSSYCDYPPEAQKTEKVGDMMNPDVEKIISLRPDLVFVGHWKWEVPDKLRKVGIRVVEVQDAETLKDSLDRILFFGHQTGREKQAAAIVASMQKRIDALRARSLNLRPQPTVFVELDAGQWTVGGKSYINDLFQVLGIVNVFADRSEPYLMVTLESIVSRSPDLLISLCRTSREYLDSSSWSAVKAVRNRKIIDQRAIDWNAITHQGPRLVDGMEALEKQIRTILPGTSLEKSVGAALVAVHSLRAGTRRAGTRPAPSVS